MAASVQVQIVGAPVACADGVKDSWRDVANWVSQQLAAHFGDSVSVIYFDLFDPDCPSLPPNVHLPVVMVESSLLSAGGKISVPRIRKHLEALGLDGPDRSG